MCGLFGFSSYSGLPIKDLSDLTNALAEQSAVRGIDATGIAFCKSGNINIIKEPKSAYAIDFKHSDDICALIGHTRHSTQGDNKKNFNNHPFFGKAKGTRFALAHNGVLMNDDTLKESLHLPKTKIETDSYVAVQLIESRKEFSIKSIRYMAESVMGSFSFSILDDKRNLYLVKGDSPLEILHFPKHKIYVYASTENILYKALVDTYLFDALKKGGFESVPIEEGEILKIQPNGNLERHNFQYSIHCGKYWWEYSPHTVKVAQNDNEHSDYLDTLRTMALFMGLPAESVDELLREGFSLDEVEEYLYDYECYC